MLETLSRRAKGLFSIPPFAVSAEALAKVEKGGSGGIFPLRQQTLADQLGCSRRSIGRALKELKEAGLLVDLNRRHKNRCKMYSVRHCERSEAIQPPWIATSAAPPRNDEMTPQGEQQLKLYRFTFEVNLRGWPDWEKYYPQVSRELAHVTDPNLLFRQTFDRLYAVRDSSDRLQ